MNENTKAIGEMKMLLKLLYTQDDFLSLTKDDIIRINGILEEKIPDDSEEHEYIYKHIETLEKDPQIEKILANKILAGQISVKWYTFEYSKEFTKEDLKKKLESKENGYGNSAEKRITDEFKDDIASIVSEGDIYTIKVTIANGKKTISDGTKIFTIPLKKSIIVKIDIKNCWVEIRVKYDKCKKVERILDKKLGIKDLHSVDILKNYNGDITEFKDDLVDGFYLNSNGIPNENIELTEEDGKAVIEIIKIVDNYLVDKDEDELLSGMKNIGYNTDGISLSSLFLAGLNNLSLKIRTDSQSDLSSQYLYNLLKEHVSEHTGYIRFSIKENGEAYTMQVGVKTNSIAFRTSVTEEVIKYIRDKVI